MKLLHKYYKLGESDLLLHTNDPVGTIEQYIDRILNKSELYELEIRLGKVRENKKGKKRFDTLIDKDTYFRLLKIYQTEADSLQFVDTVFYEINHKKVRARFDRNGQLLESIKKIRKSSTIRKGLSDKFDLRFSIAKEVAVDSKIQFSKKKSIRKRRSSFYYPYTVVDFTITNRGKISEHRIEVELVDLEFSKEQIPYVSNEIKMHLKRLSK